MFQQDVGSQQMNFNKNIPPAVSFSQASFVPGPRDRSSYGKDSEAACNGNRHDH